MRLTNDKREGSRRARLFEDRQLYIRSGAENHYLEISRRAQIIAAIGLYVVIAGLSFAGFAWVAREFEHAERGDRIAELETRIGASLEERRLLAERNEETLRDLRTTAGHQRETIEKLQYLNEAMNAELAATLAQIQHLTEERDRARNLARTLDRGVRDAEQWLSSAVEEKAESTAEIAALEARSETLTAERDVARRAVESLEWRLQLFAQRVEQMRGEREEAVAWFEDIIGDQADGIVRVLERAQIDVALLMDRAAEDIALAGAAQGGPLEFASGDDGLDMVGAGAPSADLTRLQAAQKLMGATPLAEPMEDARVTSGFGRRRDPITGRAALHKGLDFGAPAGSEVRVTAPGVVARAGRHGAYGNLVEIDHGMGIVTRYAHLRSIAVEIGQRLNLHDAVGVIGNTGRSTGRHLHYEVRIDGKPLDPAPFIEAGRNLIHVFQG